MNESVVTIRGLIPIYGTAVPKSNYYRVYRLDMIMYANDVSDRLLPVDIFNKLCHTAIHHE